VPGDTGVFEHLCLALPELDLPSLVQSSRSTIGDQ
jgi:hypothetical protein